MVGGLCFSPLVTLYITPVYYAYMEDFSRWLTRRRKRGWGPRPPAFAAAIGLVSVFCGAVNCPIASVILSIELFGSGGLVYFAAACALSYLLSGYCGLYSSQTILYSKLKAEFINVHTHE